MGNLIVEILFSAMILSVLLAFGFMLLFSPRKRTAKIILHIFVVIVYIFLMIFGAGMNDDYNIWQTILAFVVAYIPSYLIGYLVMWWMSDVCPDCGEWNSMELVKTLAQNNYKQRVDVERDIRNKEGKKIGSYDASEIHDFTDRVIVLKCKVCGKEVITTMTTES